MHKENLRRKIKNVILQALHADYLAGLSNVDERGAAYLEVSLDGEAIGGYRRDRSTLFNAFDFSGRRVLDWGSNLGELCRLARRRGAAFAEGVECDPYLNQIAQLINAYENVTRASFFHGDLQTPEAIEGVYDVTLVFSAIPQVLQVIEKLAKYTTEILILETHLVGDLRKAYIHAIGKCFPKYTFVDFTDSGRDTAKRSVLAFAKTANGLDPGGVLTSSVDLQSSEFGFLKPILSLVHHDPRISSRTSEMERLVATHWGEANDANMLTAGRAYWLNLVKGYLEYRSAGCVAMSNTYVQFIRHIVVAQPFDPELAAVLSSDEGLIERVTMRYRDADLLVQSTADIAPVDPILVFDPTAETGTLTIRHGGTGGLFYANLIDGYHRLFWATLFGFRKLPASFMFT
jgi:SAM-dependent methyltransferase